MTRCAGLGSLGALLLGLLAAVPSTLAAPGDTDWFRDARYGVFMHFLPSDDRSLALTEKFDVEALAGQLESMGAKYFIITIYQNSGYFIAPNATYNSITGYKSGEKCSNRDLPRDLYNALKPRNIKLMLYVTSQTPNTDPRAQKAFGLPQGAKDQPIDPAFAQRWATVIQGWSDRYGDKVAGWWFDGCYEHIHFNEEIAGIYANAAKHGNPHSLVTFNPGVKVLRYTKAEDYTAGELNDPFDVVPASRWVDGSQWHALTFLGSNWAHRDTRFPDAAWVKWLKAVVAHEGVATLDMGPNFDPNAGPIGTLAEPQVKQVQAIKAALSEPAGATPHVFRVSEGVAPGRLVSLYGEGLQTAKRIAFFTRDGALAGAVAPVQVDEEGHFCRVVFPAIEPGVYRLQVETNAGVFEGQAFVNRAAPRWLSEERAYPGLILQLIGRNLDGAAFGAVRKTQVRLVPTAGGEAVTIAPDAVSPYCVRFQVPGQTALGPHFVEVRTGSAGLGEEWVRLTDASDCPEAVKDVVLDVEQAPDDALARSLGVAWANDFHWKKVLDAKTGFGARGDGRTDDTAAIQNAITRAAQEGGGVVWLSQGVYRVSGLALDKGVVLRGESNTAAVLRFFVSDPKPGAEYSVFRGTDAGDRDGLIGLANVGVEFEAGLPVTVPVRLIRLGDFGRMTATRIFLYGNRFDMPFDSPKWTGLLLSAAGPVLIAKNEWKGNGPSWSHGIRHNLICRDNTFDFANEQVSLSSDRMIFENNVMTGHNVPGVTTSLHGLFTESWVGYNVWNEYIAHNTARDLNYVPGNDGEAFALDSPGFFLFGDMIEGEPDSTLLRADSTAVSGNIGWEREWQALVIKGKGLGQLRRVAGHVEDPGHPGTHRIRISPAWDIPPDETSKIAIVRMHVGVIFEDNTATDCCGPATQFYHCCYDCVASGTVGTRTQGVINYGGYWGNPNTPKSDRSAMMSYFTQVRYCRVSGASARFKNTWIGDRGEDSLSASPCFAPCVYGSEFRDNAVDRKGCEAINDYDGKYPAGFCVAIQNAGTTGRSILGSLFEGNLVKNSKHGYAINSPGCVHVLISRPLFEQIGATPLINQGRGTLLLDPRPPG